MLFIIDESVSHARHSSQVKVTELVEELFRARASGRHIVFSTSTILDDLSELPGLSGKAVRSINAVKRRLRSKLSIVNSVTWRVLLVGDEREDQVVEDQSGLTIVVSIFSPGMEYLFREVNLVVENQTDGDLYSLVGAVRSKQLGQMSLSTCLTVRPGGGSQTPRLYEQHKRTQELSLCIVDGDMDYFGCSYGSNTAAPIRDSDAERPKARCHSYVIECYSAENLIPPPLYSLVYGLEFSQAPWIERLHRFSSCDFWQYLPLKQKRVCSDFKPVAEKSIYWSARSDHFEIGASCKDGYSGAVCDGKCEVFVPLDKKVLSTVVSALVSGDRNALVSKVDSVASASSPSIVKMWREIGDRVFSWGCSGGRLSLV